MRKKTRLKKHIKTDSSIHISSFDFNKEDLMHQIILKYSDMIHFTALKFTNNLTEAEEVSQEVFLTIYKKINTLKNLEALSSWIYIITKNIANQKNRTKKQNYNLLNKIEKDNTDLNSDYAYEPIDESLMTTMLDLEAKEIIDKAVQKLPEKYKTVFILNEYQNIPLKNISQILNISVPAAKSRLHRARVSLKDSLRNYFCENIN